MIFSRVLAIRADVGEVQKSNKEIMHDTDHTIICIAKTDILSDECLFNAFYKGVSEARRKKVDRFLFYPDKRMSLGVEVLLYAALDRYGFDRNGCGPENAGGCEETSGIRFGIGEYGKPYIEGHGNIFFNMSHSDDYVMAVVSDREVGCDIQKMGGAEMDLAERFFCEQEFRHLSGQPTDTEKRDMFYRYWTLKESFMKATGLGMELALSDFEVRPGDGKIVRQAVDDREYYFREFDLEGDFKAAVCIADRQTDAEPEIVELDRIRI